MCGSVIDTSFDVRTDAGGRDPDRYSKTLRRYHQLLWSKPLPSGAILDLDQRLHHHSDLGEFWFSSDSISQSYSYWFRPPRLVAVLAAVSQEEQAAFEDVGSTIGAFIIFPISTFVDNRFLQTINQARGINSRIRDRIDLTLECIRRYYVGPDSPLKDVLTAHGTFFNMFEDFTGYVEHFLLQDLVNEASDSVRFFKSFDDFSYDALPAASLAEYREYMTRSVAFVHARNARIAAFSSDLWRVPG